MSLANMRLGKAVAIIEGPGNRRAQLASAFKEQLLRLRPSDLPPDLRRKFTELVNTACQSGLLKCPSGYPEHEAGTEPDIDALCASVIALHAAVSLRASALPLRDNEADTQGRLAL